MDQLTSLTDSTGHAAEVRPAQSGMWADAHRPGGIARNEMAIQLMEQEITSAIEQDPEGAAKSWIGRIHLLQYGFLLGDMEDIEKAMGCKAADKPQNWEYPYKFGLRDVLLASKWIIAQLVAEEYFEKGPESTPYTPEALINVNLGEDQPYFSPVPKDVFATKWRPPVDLTIFNADGTIETINEAGKEPGKMPNFKEL